MDLEKKAFERLKLGAETSEHLYNAPLIICYSEELNVAVATVYGSLKQYGNKMI